MTHEPHRHPSRSSTVRTFLVGCFVGVILTLFGVGIIKVGQGFSQWGALELHSDFEVRKRIRNAGIHLPHGAHDLYHAGAGFVDGQTWIKFTVPTDEIWQVVAQSIQKTQADFTAEMPEHLILEVHHNRGQSYDLTWWNPSTVSHRASWSKQTENPNGSLYFEDWLIDLDTGTFFITCWDT